MRLLFRYLRKQNLCIIDAEVLARRKRFELLTFWSVARRSIQLS